MNAIRDKVAAKKSRRRAARQALRFVRWIPMMAMIALVITHDTMSTLILVATAEVGWLAGVALERFSNRRTGARNGR